MNAQGSEKSWRLEMQDATHKCPQCATIWLVPVSINEGQLICKACGCRAWRHKVSLPNSLPFASLPLGQLQATS